MCSGLLSEIQLPTLRPPVLLTLALGLASALLLERPLAGRDAFRTILFLPYIIPYAAYALLWYWLFDPRYGLVNYLLSFVGIGAVPWLKSSEWVLPAFVLMSVWKRLGFAMVAFLAGLQTIPSELYDAAIMDGAGPWQRFHYVTMPMLSPITLFIAVISIIYSLQIFVEPLVMTHGGPGDSSQTLSYLLYEQGGETHSQCRRRIGERCRPLCAHLPDHAGALAPF